MKKTLFSLFNAVSLALLYCPAAFALTEDEAAAAVDAQGKDAVSGNLFLWLLCAIAFLKVATKLDGILHSLASAFLVRPARCSPRHCWLSVVLTSEKLYGAGRCKSRRFNCYRKSHTQQHLCRRAFRHGKPSCAAKYSKLHQWTIRRHRYILGRCHVSQQLGKDGASPARSSALSPPGRQAAVLQVTAPWKRSMVILQVPATWTLCRFPPPVKIFLLQ